MINKEIALKNAVKKLFLDRNLEIDEYIINNFYDELKNESHKNLNKLFIKLRSRNYYQDFTKTKVRMPNIIEAKEVLKAIKSDTYITPDEFCLAMPKEEKQRKLAIHLDMSEKIKQFLKNGAKDEELDVIFAQN